MTTEVQHTVIDPTTGPIVGAQVVVDLYPSGPGYVNSLDMTVIAPVKHKTDANGLVTFDLVANTDIVPAGTVWRVRDYPAKGIIRTQYISVPDSGGPYWLGDLLVDPPASVASAALTNHLDDEEPHDPAGFSRSAYAILSGSSTSLTGANIPLTFDSVTADSDGFVQTMDRLTIPSGMGLAGLYLISGQLQVASGQAPATVSFGGAFSQIYGKARIRLVTGALFNTIVVGPERLGDADEVQMFVTSPGIDTDGPTNAVLAITRIGNL